MELFNPERRLLLLALGTCGAGLASASMVFADNAKGPRVIKVTAETFKFTPDKIELKADEEVILEITSLDVPMGFNVPSMRVRIDVVPDMPVQLKLPPARQGTHRFFCDIVCGSGHSKMTGTLVVT